MPWCPSSLLLQAAIEFNKINFIAFSSQEGDCKTRTFFYSIKHNHVVFVFGNIKGAPWVCSILFFKHRKQHTNQKGILYYTVLYDTVLCCVQYQYTHELYSTVSIILATVLYSAVSAIDGDNDSGDKRKRYFYHFENCIFIVLKKYHTHSQCLLLWK